MAQNKKERRVILNDDGWIMAEAWPPLRIDDLRQQMVATYEGTAAGALCWCVGNNEVYSYETEVGERFGAGCDDLDPVQQRERDNLISLIEAHGGPLQLMVELCHEAGLDLFPSIRMNSHYETGPNQASGRLRREHPEWLIGRPGEELAAGSLEWGLRTGVNYVVPEVRRHMARIIFELIDRFDIDGIELDFMRHPAFFRPQEAYANRYLMTDLLRCVRQRLDQAGAERGKIPDLAARVPPTLADAARLGLDAEVWIKEGLVDLVIAGGGFIPFDMPLEEFVEAARGTPCQVYGCIEHLRPAMDDAVIRGIASRFWSAGADGIYLFNYFGKSPEWKRRMLNQLADPAALQRQDKRFHMEWTDRLAPSDLHDYAFRYAVPSVQLPVVLAEAQVGSGPVLCLGIDDVEEAWAEGAVHSCVLRLKMDHYKAEDELEIRLNGEVLYPGRASFGGWKRLEWTQFPQRVIEAEHAGGSLEFDLSAPPLHEGENAIEIRLVKRTVQQPEPVVLRDVELAIEYSR